MLVKIRDEDMNLPINVELYNKRSNVLYKKMAPP